MHPRQVLVVERGDGAAEVVRLQAGDMRALEQELEELRPGEDPRDQLAVLQVVACEGYLVLVKASLDLGHTVVRIVDGLTLAEHRLRDMLQAVGREPPLCRTHRFDAVDNQPPRHGREEKALAPGMAAPLDGLGTAAQEQRNAVLVRVRLEHAKIELHDAPPDEDVRIVFDEPGIEALDDLGGIGHVCQREVLRRYIVHAGVAEHVDLPLAAALKGEGIEVARGAGFDIERHDAERRPIVGHGAELRIEDGITLLRAAFHAYRRRDETLHHVALGRPYIGFVRHHAAVLQPLLQKHHLPVAAGVDAQHGLLLERLQR